jgi:hypothetical protein
MPRIREAKPILEVDADRDTESDSTRLIAAKTCKYLFNSASRLMLLVKNFSQHSNGSMLA